LSLGERRYLEIIAPDPGQPDASDPLCIYLKTLSGPRIVNWAVHPGDLTRFAKVLGEAGIVFKGPLPGSRKRPDGSVLHWQTLTLEENPNRLLPFFIEWGAGSIHPSVDSPEGCDLLYFGAASPGADAVRTKFRQISVELSVERGDREELRARFSGRKGEFELTS
jgi:hypothetical protein